MQGSALVSCSHEIVTRAYFKICSTFTHLHNPSSHRSATVLSIVVFRTSQQCQRVETSSEPMLQTSLSSCSHSGSRSTHTLEAWKLQTFKLTLAAIYSTRLHPHANMAPSSPTTSTLFGVSCKDYHSPVSGGILQRPIIPTSLPMARRRLIVGGSFASIASQTQ